MTARIVAAMRNPYVSVIAHPTGRLIGELEAYEVDMDEVLRVARETGTALEINSYPLRLDLSDSYARRAQSQTLRNRRFAGWYGMVQRIGCAANSLVRFDPRTKSFALWPVLSGGGVIRNMAATPHGEIYIACSGVNKIGIVRIE
jgi:streptogramin lyase